MAHPVQRKEMEEVFAMMGVALATLHEIEKDFASSFLVGLTERQKKKFETMEELLEARNKMTFGQLVSHMKEQWILKPEVGQFIDVFLQERNTFIHGLTALEGYNPRYKQQRVKLKLRILQFMEMALLARRIFRAASFASNDFASWWLKEHKDVDIKLPHDPNIQEEIDFFLALLGDQREELQL